MIRKDATFRIYVSTYKDMSTKSTATIKYVDPSGTSGDWTASVSGSASAGILYYDVTSTSNTKSGTYRVWSWAVFSDGTTAVGEEDTFVVHP